MRRHHNHDTKIPRLPSYWLSETVPVPSDELTDDRAVDICIVGAGLTGLWAAYYLRCALPDAEIAVLEKEYAGYGASGRNAGWLTSEFAGNFADLAARGGPGAVTSMHEAMCETVNEVIAICDQEGIDADIVRGGALRVAQNGPQLTRAQQAHSRRAEWHADKGVVWLSASETRERVAMAGARGAEFNEYGARVQPAKLVRGLLELVRRLGVRVHEGTEVLHLEKGRALTARGTVTSPVVLRCLEGYTAQLPGHRLDWLPMHSSVVVTEVIPPAIWEEIGWAGCELVADFANQYAAGQRTAAGRIAMGGRGALPRYRFGSMLEPSGGASDSSRDVLADAIARMFPALRKVNIEHAWCGVLAIPRNWSPTVTFEPRSGLGWAGGYVGSGVSTTNLAGRTLADLVAGRATDVTKLPWVGSNVRPWEPEPLRWLGVRSMSALFRAADRREYGGARSPSRLAALGDRIIGS